jgi:NADH:ubiquinone oxidoreductase subunit F (NADH-binding)/NADH:ubiquinone oxidoreductase subunit E
MASIEAVSDATLSSTPKHSLPRRLRYWESRGGETSVYHGIRDYIREHGLPDVAAICKLAEELRIPAATVRGVATFYADLPGDEAHVVCDGTSCRLAGSEQVCQRLKESGGQVKKVYCLGYCDRSPALLDATGSVRLDEYHESQHLPDVRNVAKTAVVTHRLMNGGAATLQSALEHGVYEAARNALERHPADLLDAMVQSGERGRGGAGFLTGQKWKACAGSQTDQRYVIANGDEGDPGSFIDRVLMEDDPHRILEGMLICGYAVGATKGIIYIRSEYPRALQCMQTAIDEARAEGFLGKGIFGGTCDFDVEVFPGMGSYVCGEETAMINAIEGLRGEVQIRPPYPTQHGLYGKPTVVNNVETLVNVPFIVQEGAAAYAKLGTEASNGTKVISLNHGFARPGLVEVEFGVTFNDVIHEFGGGARDGKQLVALIVGGPMGSIVLPKDWDLPICYEALSRNHIELGHGGIVALTEDADFAELLDHWVQFMIDESCGKCVPCRLGSQCAGKALRSSQSKEAILARLDEIFTAMEQGSLCAFGQFMPGPMRQLIEHFGDRIFESGDRHV